MNSKSEPRSSFTAPKQIRCWLSLITACLITQAVGCSERPRETLPSPVLTLVDSIRLLESDSVVLGRLGTVIALSNGSYLIADAQNFTIREFDRDGKQLRSIGRRGRGPGEFDDFGPIAFDGDHGLFVQSGLTMHELDYRTGAHVREAPFPAPFAGSIAAARGTVFFRTIDQQRGPRVAIWRNQQIEAGADLPRPSDQNHLLDAVFTATALAPIGEPDSVIAAIQSSDDLFIGSFRGPFTRIPVARLHRQGSRPDLMARIAENPEIASSDPQIAYTPSVPTALARLSSGEIAYAASDYTFVRDHFAAKLHLSVVDPGTRRTCPDARIPGAEDPPPSVVFRGDTLVVVTQEISGAQSNTWIRRYVITTEGCTWIGT